MKAFITGVTGFVGGFLAEHLLAEGDEVLGCSTNAIWPDDFAEQVSKAANLIRWDVSCANGLADEDRARIARFAPDCIYHLAAISVPRLCGVREPTALAMAVNVDGTARVLELALGLASRPRVVFVSSSHVYPLPMDGKECRVAEDSDLAPRGGYGLTKHLGEQKVLEAVHKRGLKGIIVRAFQHTGPRQKPPLMVPEWTRQFFEKPTGPIKVKNLSTMMDMSDVRDVVRAYRLLAERAGAGSVFNVGSGVNLANRAILEQIQRWVGSDRAIEVQEHKPKQEPIADIGRLTLTTGWRPCFALEFTIQATVDYWRASAWRSKQLSSGRIA